MAVKTPGVAEEQTMEFGPASLCEEPVEVIAQPVVVDCEILAKR